MNLGQLRTSLQARGYGTDTATVQTELINGVYRRIAGRRRWKWTEAQSTAINTVAGTSAYASITDFLYPDAMRIEVGTDYTDLEYMDYEVFRAHQYVDRDRGKPEFWTYGRGQLHLWPTPDRVYNATLDYTKDPPDLSADSDTPLFPTTYHDILVWGAIVDITFRQRDWGGHSYATQKFNEHLVEMERAQGIRQRQTSSHVIQSGFFDQPKVTW